MSLLEVSEKGQYFCYLKNLDSQIFNRNSFKVHSHGLLDEDALGIGELIRIQHAHFSFANSPSSIICA